MGTSDGRVVGVTKILDAGAPALRWNLVLVGDGYRASELPKFANDAQGFVTKLLRTSPFDQLGGGINVYRVDVSSTDSGADEPAACGGTGRTAATYFDASFCSGGIQRLLVVNTGTVFSVVSAQVPEWHMIMVLVNATTYGGSGGPVSVFSTAPDAAEIGLHEMGHTAFGLADEYPSWAGCDVDTDRNTHPAVEPTEPNVTITADRRTIKWRALIRSATPVPTTRNTDCARCDPQSSPVPAGTVGAFEGAHHYHCGAYRPEFTCRMRELNAPFCAVCQQRIREVLTPFVTDEPAECDSVREQIRELEAELAQLRRRLGQKPSPAKRRALLRQISSVQAKIRRRKRRLEALDCRPEAVIAADRSQRA